MVERCIFVVCLDKGVKSTSNNKENIETENTPPKPNTKIQQLNGNSSNTTTDDNMHHRVNGENKSVGGGGSGGGGGGDIPSSGAATNMTSVREEKEDESIGEKDEAESMEARMRAAHLMMHGCNSQNSSGNRWFDKTMQFIISEDGECGINYEHSPAEGIVVIELSEHLFRYM